MENQLKFFNFSCKKCGKCCSGRFGDNAVYVRFDEIEEISEKINLSPDEFTVPLIPDLYNFDEESETCEHKLNMYKILENISFQIDEDGFVHTPGRMLSRKKSGDCIFLDDKIKNHCFIYDFRPDLCKTFPFYTISGRLDYCKCEGLEKKLDSFELNKHSDYDEKIVKMSMLLDKREFKDKVEMESIKHHFLKNKNKRFGTKEGLKKAYKNAENNLIKCVVYDINEITNVDYYF